MKRSESPAATCPKCKYDLSGSPGFDIESMKTSTAQHTCAECGLTFEWRDILDPLRAVPTWFVENPAATLVFAAAGTWGQSLVPWQFWKLVRVTFPTRPPRLWAYMALLAVCIHVSAALIPLAAGTRGLVLGRGSASAYDNVMNLAGTAVCPYPSLDKLFCDGSTWMPAPLDPLATQAEFFVAVFLCSMLIVPLVMRQTLGSLKVRFVHVWRVWVYTLGLAPLYVVAHDIAQVGLRDQMYGWWSPNGLTFGARTQLFGLVVEQIDCVMPVQQAIAGAFLAFTVFGWWFGLRRYLRVPSAWSALLAAVIVAGLTTAVVASLMQLAGCNIFE